MNKILVEVHKEMPYSKYQISTPSSFREKKLKMGFFVPMFQLVTPQGGTTFEPKGKCGRGPQGDAIDQISKL